MPPDDDLIVEVDPNIEMGFDADGLPKTVLREQPKKADDIQFSKEDREQIEDLKRQRDQALADAARARAEAATRVNDAESKRLVAETAAVKHSDEALRHRWEKTNAEYDSVKSMIQSQKVEMETAKAAVRTASEAGDSSQVADLQERIATLAATQVDLQKAERSIKSELGRIEEDVRGVIAARKTEKTKIDEAPKPELKQPTPEEWIDGVRKSVGDKVANWLNENRQFVTDTKLNNKVIKFADAYQAMEEKPLNSDDFIAELNAKFLPKKAAEPTHDDNIIEIDMNPSPPRAASVAAPVSRAVTPARSSTGDGVNRIRLTPEMAKHASLLFEGKRDPDTGKIMTEQDARRRYGANMMRAQAEGKFEQRE